MRRAWIGLGSNLGDRERHLAAALAALSAADGVGGLRTSPIYESEPWDEPAGAGGAPWYLNAVAELDTALSPHRLLELCRRVEAAGGRARPSARRPRGPSARRPRGPSAPAPRRTAAPRTIDLDLLLCGDEVIDDGAILTVPHPRLHLRAFVLRPLADLAPTLVHPRLGRRITELLADLADAHAVRPWAGAETAQ